MFLPSLLLFASTLSSQPSSESDPSVPMSINGPQITSFRSTFGPNQGRPFTDLSPWNKAIPANPKLDSRSTAIRNYLKVPYTIYANTQEFGVPIFYADGNTPTYTVHCLENWGTCGLEGRSVPIPDNATPSSGSDAAMVVVDFTNKLSWEFWGAKKNGGTWTTDWGGVISTSGKGVDAAASLPTGAGIPRLAGVIRVYEMKQGHIDHALIFASSNSCRNGFRSPAVKTDGQSTRSDCIPEGMRIQLDPRVNVNAIAGITEGEKIIAKALQTYGAYCMDVADGVHATFIFETPQSGDPYGALGIDSQNPELIHLPMGNIRALNSWNGI